jgi:hypothetical protein
MAAAAAAVAMRRHREKEKEHSESSDSDSHKKKRAFSRGIHGGASFSRASPPLAVPGKHSFTSTSPLAPQHVSFRSDEDGHFAVVRASPCRNESSGRVIQVTPLQVDVPEQERSRASSCSSLSLSGMMNRPTSESQALPYTMGSLTVQVREVDSKPPRQSTQRGWTCVPIIDPRSNHCIAYWDLVATLALVFTALITPFEVAFLTPPGPSERWGDPLFRANRCVDIVFITDMLLQFRTAYKHEDMHEGTRWVTNGSTIATHYLCSFWFCLDLFSVLTSLFDLVGGEETKDLTALRAVRTLRLIKLVKLARGSRIFKRWELRMSINYAHLSLATCVAIILLGCHWTACIWGLQATFNPLGSWPGEELYCVPWGSANQSVAEEMLATACPADKVCDIGKCDDSGVCREGMACEGPYSMYALSLYFAIMTFTSVGYGDIAATPFNPEEQIVCGVIMLLSGMLWGYLVGVFCTLAAAAPSVQAFRDELSELNSFMASYGLDSELRFRLREFIHEAVHLQKHQARTQLLSKLSPAMQGEVSLLVNQRWVSKVWYLRSAAQLELLIDIASRLKAQVFAPWEFCPCGEMYIVNRGTALWAGKPRHEGSTWGEDVLLDNQGLQLDFSALAITYLWVFTIDAGRLLLAINRFPESARRLHAIRQRWIVRRAVVRVAERECHRRGVEFRGRLFPIYAKEIATAKAAENIAHQLSPACRLSRVNRASRLSRSVSQCLSGRLSSSSSREPSQKGERRPSLRGGRSRKGSSLEDILRRSVSLVSPTKKKAMISSSSAMKAAANFGLHQRKEQLRANRVDDDEEDERRMETLFSEVSQLKTDMQEVLEILRGGGHTTRGDMREDRAEHADLMSRIGATSAQSE